MITGTKSNAIEVKEDGSRWHALVKRSNFVVTDGEVTLHGAWEHEEDAQRFRRSMCWPSFKVSRVPEYLYSVGSGVIDPERVEWR